MSFIKKNLDWILVILFTIVFLLYPGIEFLIKHSNHVNAWGTEKQSILFLYTYVMVWIDSFFYYIILLPIPISILVTFRFVRRIKEKQLLTDDYKKENIRQIFKEVFLGYKRIIIYFTIISFIFLMAILFVPNTGFVLEGSEELQEAIRLYLGYTFISIIISNVSIIVARFVRRRVFIVIVSFLSYTIIMIGLAYILDGIFISLGLELYGDSFLFYNLMMEDKFLIELIYALLWVVVTWFIIYFIYVGDKALEGNE